MRFPLLPVILLLAMVVLRWNYTHQGGGFLSDDGYQYMDAAANFANGGCLCTNLAHFDEQVDFGRFPVPFTHFAPGYPLMMAAFMHFAGLPAESAALVASSLGYFLSVALLWLLCRNLGANRSIASGACVFWIVNSLVLFYAAGTSTEMPFTALLLLMALGVVVDLRKEGRYPQILVLIGTAAALSYWMRYAGLFLVFAALGYIAYRGSRSRRWLWPALAVVSMASLTGAIMLRNAILIGSWKGGFAEMHSRETFQGALIGSIKGIFHIMFGDRVPARLDFWAVLFVASSVLLVWIFVRERGAFKAKAPAYAWLALIAGLYAGGVFIASMQTIASAFSRYYLPLYPLALASIAVLVSQIPSSLWKNTALAGIAASILAIQARSVTAPSPVPGYATVRAALQSEVPNARDWIVHNTDPGEVVFGVNGQALQYVLKRPVVSIPAGAFTNRTDDEAGIRRLMERFKSRYLVLFPEMPADAVPEQTGNPFLNGLAKGEKPPAWLEPVLRTRTAMVFAVKSF